MEATKRTKRKAKRERTITKAEALRLLKHLHACGSAIRRMARSRSVLHHWNTTAVGSDLWWIVCKLGFPAAAWVGWRKACDIVPVARTDRALQSAGACEIRKRILFRTINRAALRKLAELEAK